MGMHVAVVGGGFVGRVHLEAMLAHPAISAVSLAESDEAALAELAGRYPLARTTTDYRALIDDPTVDIVDICLPHDLHHPVALEAFAAGRHVIADKPIANTLAEADEMMVAAEAAGRRFFVALNERFLPVHQRVGELLAQGFLGRPSLALLVVAGSELPRLRIRPATGRAPGTEPAAVRSRTAARTSSTWPTPGSGRPWPCAAILHGTSWRPRTGPMTRLPCSWSTPA